MTTLSVDKKCQSCGKRGRIISGTLGICLDCIRSRFRQNAHLIENAHYRSRTKYGLPDKPPDDKSGVKCNICINRCRIPEGSKGFCSLRENREGKIVHLAGTSQNGAVSWYYDSLPTNCVADWVCPGGSSAGYPEYSYAKGPEYGYENLAVFYEACTFNCLFCQNWHFRERKAGEKINTSAELAAAVRPTTACICYFGGDPTAQAGHALAVSRLAIKRNPDRILRICWETNGSMQSAILQSMARLSMDSGGCIKFDLKAYDENLNIALCGVSNRQTLENFQWLAEFSKRRPDPPMVVASTLMVPGYIDSEEISKIAGFIASLDKSVPYSLLAFYPCFYMSDMPRTSRRHAEECYDAARSAGLERVKVGNLHLLSNDY